MVNRLSSIILILIFSISLCACRSGKREVTVFAAKSLNSSLDEIISLYEAKNPSVDIVTNYDSSGTLVNQILTGGAECDVFFSASESKVNELEDNDLIVPGSDKVIINNQLCVVTYKGSDTRVTGLSNLDKAASLAIADATVPIGEYTRKSLYKLGLISGIDISDTILSDELGGVTINNCSNAGMVVAAILEHANEVATVYYSDIAGHEDELVVIEKVPYEISGQITYPAALLKNNKANDEAKSFFDYLSSDEAGDIFRKYNFTLEN